MLTAFQINRSLVLSRWATFSNAFIIHFLLSLFATAAAVTNPNKSLVSLEVGNLGFQQFRWVRPNIVETFVNDVF